VPQRPLHCTPAYVHQHHSSLHTEAAHVDRRCTRLYACSNVTQTVMVSASPCSRGDGGDGHAAGPWLQEVGHLRKHPPALRRLLGPLYDGRLADARMLGTCIHADSHVDMIADGCHHVRTKRLARSWSVTHSVRCSLTGSKQALVGPLKLQIKPITIAQLLVATAGSVCCW